MLRLVRGWAGTLKSDVIAIDGKALRWLFSDASKRSPRHLVQAFAAEARMTPGQVKVDGKSNEIAALPELLEMLSAGRLWLAENPLFLAVSQGRSYT